MNAVYKHWTSENTEAFVYRISSDFILQLEKRMEGLVSQSDLSKRLNVTKGRVSQVFNNPGNLTLKKIVEYSRALGMKVAVVAYDDGDFENNDGPINSEIFYRCWQNCGKPDNFFSLNNLAVNNCVSVSVVARTIYASGPSNYIYAFNSSALSGAQGEHSSTLASNSRDDIVSATTGGAPTGLFALSDTGQSTALHLLEV